jgi:hypothetical protein
MFAAQGPPVSLTPLANLPPVSLILVVVHLDLQISLRIFEQIRSDPDAIFRGFGENNEKRPEAKNLVTLSL